MQVFAIGSSKEVAGALVAVGVGLGVGVCNWVVQGSGWCSGGCRCRFRCRCLQLGRPRNLVSSCKVDQLP